MVKLSEPQIEARLEQAEGWKLEDSKWIMKKYRFREFMAAIRFVDKVAVIAERLNHHPFISIDYKMVTIKITSWSAGGLTEFDFTSASEYDQVYEKTKV